jgi:hypothetical protein
LVKWNSGRIAGDFMGTEGFPVVQGAISGHKPTIPEVR